MSKFTRLVVLISGLMVLCGIAVPTAGAASWTNSGDTAFTATTGPSTLTANGTTLICTGGTMTGTAPASAAGPTYPASGSLNYSGCRLAIIGVAVSCSWTFLGTSVSGPIPLRVSGTIAVNCTVTGGCRISGTVTVTYTNPIPGITSGSFFISANQSLVVSGVGCVLGSGAAAKTAEVWNFIAGLPARIRGMLLRQP
jgi:hypothetical protein